MVITIGIICLMIGLLLKFFPPKRESTAFAYRTQLSLINKDTWNEAQKYSASSFIFLGVIFVPFQFILSNLNISYNSEILIVLTSIFLMIASVEMRLKKIFNDDGTRKI